MIHFKQVVRHIAKKARSNRYRWKKQYGFGGDAETADYVRCYCKAKGHCEYCGEHVTFFKGQYDHIYSRAKGGDNSAVNLALCCPNCNERKGSKHPAQFAAEQRAKGIWTSLIGHLLNKYDTDPGVQLSLQQSEQKYAVKAQ